jgi:two-component system, OmpR family, response regulator RegX3
MDWSSASVLLVSADESLRAGVVEDFAREHLAVRLAADGAEGLTTSEDDRFDLVIVSAVLPDTAGRDVCLALHRRSSVPIMVVSTVRSEEDLVATLAAGADAFVVNPSRRELLARCRALLRRCPPSVSRPETAPLEAGGVVMDRERHEVLVAGTPVALPRKEFQLLETLLANAGRVVSRETLMAQVWGPDYFGATKTLDVHIRRIRTKVEALGSLPRTITTVRGIGYRYEKDRPALARAS